MKIKNTFLSRLLFFATIALSTTHLRPHGFGEDTLISTFGDRKTFSTIKHIAQLAAEGEKPYVGTASDIKNRKTHINWTRRRATIAAFSTINCYYAISFKEPNTQTILCTPTQLFYHDRYRAWGPAYIFRVGSKLLCGSGAALEISDITFIKKPLKVYTFEVEETHLYLVERQQLLAHNMFIPVMTSIGFSIPFGTGCGGSVGSLFGPIGFFGGICIGGIIGYIVNICFQDRFREYDLSFTTQAISKFDHDYNYLEQAESDAQAPGKPTENDGFIPKKRWDGKKVKHRRGYGWPDENDSIWIPSGPNGHGCPHWEVQHPNGRYDNVVPGGRIRGQK